MKMFDINKIPMVRVTWLAARDTETGWLDIKDVMGAPLATCQEVGWMVHNKLCHGMVGCPAAAVSYLPQPGTVHGMAWHRAWHSAWHGMAQCMSATFHSLASMPPSM